MRRYNSHDNNESKSQLGYNYEYSLAISKCNERLEKLRNRQRYLLELKSKLILTQCYMLINLYLRKYNH